MASFIRDLDPAEQELEKKYSTYSQEALHLLAKHHNRKTFADPNLFDEYEELRRIEAEARKRFQGVFYKLSKDIRRAFDSRPDNPVVTVRRYAGIQKRMESLWLAVRDLDEAKAESWYLILYALEGAPEKVLSARGSIAAKAKAAKAKPNPEKEIAIEYARMHPGLSATQIKVRAKLKASERTIRGWVSASC